MDKHDWACVQIGLNRDFEYLSLVFPPPYASEPPPVMFYELQLEGAYIDWHFYGVDGCDASIEACKERYSYAGGDRLHFFHNCVTKQDGEEKEDMGEGLTLNSLFGKIPHPIQLVMMDIEGDETSVLEGYDFAYRPKYFFIEIHREEEISLINKIMKDQYYFLREMTYQRGRHLHCAYMKKEYASERAGEFHGNIFFPI